MKQQDSPVTQRTLYGFAVGIFLGVGTLGVSVSAEPLEEELPFDSCGRPCRPLVSSLEPEGADLVVKIQFPLSEDLQEGIWIVQRDEAGALVGEAFVEPGFAFEVAATIHDGLRAALDLGPAFVLELLDVDRQLVGDRIPLRVKLECTDAAPCTLEPVFGIAPGDAIHVPADLFSAINGVIKSGQPISLEAISARGPELVGPFLDMLWQSDFEPTPPSGCQCRWLFATDTADLTGGVHLLWTNGNAPANLNQRFAGYTELAIRLLCVLVSEPQQVTLAVDVGYPSELTVTNRWGESCAAPCEPEITQSLLYRSRASVQAGDLVPNGQGPPGSSELVDNDVQWHVGSEPSLASQEASASTVASLNQRLAAHQLELSSTLSGSSSFTRFEGQTNIALDVELGMVAVFVSSLEMNARADACEDIPALDTGVVVAPRFLDGDVVILTKCIEERHTSLVIKTGG